jgi:hypothetical protein
MWVLEARKDAEKVWFPIIWEEIKDASNVIDYDIHDEITKDTSWVINANNDTTTGMATVIPWVNAPKLIASTSIIGWWGSEETLQSTAKTSMSHDYNWPATYNVALTQFTISWETWTAKLEQTPQWIKIPLSWVYKVDLTYKRIVWEMECTDNLRVNWTTVHSFVGSWSKYWYDDPQETLLLEFNKWDIISIYLNTRHLTSSYFGFDHTVTIRFLKI